MAALLLAPGTPRAAEPEGAPAAGEIEAAQAAPVPEARPAAVADDLPGIFSIQIENDLFGDGRDRHFTNGIRLAWISPGNDVPEWVRWGASRIPLFDYAGTTRVSYAIGQSIFTPERIEERALIRDDRPYAGWLYGTVGVSSDTGRRLDRVELSLGVIGPASLAEDVQTFWHELIDTTRPEGWDNQLANEPGVMLSYERKWRALWVLRDPAGFGADATPHVGASVGNVLTHVGTGLTLRIGQNLPSDYGPPLIAPSLSGSGYFIPHDGVGWYLFVGASGRYVARDIFLDGNSFEDSHSVDKQPFVADLQAGLAFTLGRTRIAYTHVVRSQEFDGQDKPNHFGSISLSVAF